MKNVVQNGGEKWGKEGKKGKKRGKRRKKRGKKKEKGEKRGKNIYFIVGEYEDNSQESNTSIITICILTRETRRHKDNNIHKWMVH